MPAARQTHGRRRLLAAALLSLAGCHRLGPQQLDLDQIGFADALGEGVKRQMLLNMVRLRYGDVPTFLTVSQLISGYTLQTGGQAGLNAYPNANPGNYATLSGSFEFASRPTYNFTPVTGERFARSYLRPLEPAQLLSLAQSGAPLDLLFRIGVQSVNGLPNRSASGGAPRLASDDFEALMRALAAAHGARALSLRFETQPQGARVFLLPGGGDGRAEPALRELRRLLGLRGPAGEFELVYGRTAAGPGRVPVLTRSLLQILYEMGSQIEVAQEDIRRGATLGQDQAAGDRLVRVRQGARAPADAYAAVVYRDRSFWIDFDDYPSKVTFAFVQALQVLAESGPGHAPLTVTIPAQ
ncbi:hypothetical protein [Falsiroseomonas sp.]|uniref:hypothetical protein n=1 Tax=Falsiroseomonas sp. TaxID=2870721 RepID=UPI003F6F273D